MTRLASLLILIGLTLFCGGCVGALGPATSAANVVAGELKATHAQLGLKYKADQIAAAASVVGDRSDPATKAKQRDAVRVVRARYRPIWDAYALVYEAWVDAVAAIEIAEQLGSIGGGQDMLTVADMLRSLLAAQRRWSVLVQQLRGEI